MIFTISPHKKKEDEPPFFSSKELLFNELDPAAQECHAVTGNRGGTHTNQTRKDEGVVDNKLTNLSCTGAVEFDRC